MHPLPTKVPKILKEFINSQTLKGPVVQWIAPIAIGGSFLSPFPAMCFVYIIQSEADDTFYVGYTRNLSERLDFHNDPKINSGVTRHKIPWKYFYTLKAPNCKVAIKIEKHIKRMKSQSYINNLKKYPEMGQKLLKKYS